MNQKYINSVSRQIYSRFPEVDGCKPNIRQQALPKGSSSCSTYLLTFHGKVEIQSGKYIDRYVRVVADEQGTIIKVTTSR